MKIVVPSCSSLMSMFEPFFHGRNVDTGAIRLSFTPPLRGAGSFGSMPTANVPGNGCRSSTMPGLNSAVRFCRSSVKNLMKPSGISEASAPMVGNSFAGRLKFTANGFGSILRMRISSTSPGSAPFTKIGPVTECGPPARVRLAQLHDLLHRDARLHFVV